MTDEVRCFMCARQQVLNGDPPVKDEDWSLFDLILITEAFATPCDHHKKYCEKRIPELKLIEAAKPKETAAVYRPPAYSPPPLKTRKVERGRDFTEPKHAPGESW